MTAWKSRHIGRILATRERGIATATATAELGEVFRRVEAGVAAWCGSCKLSECVLCPAAIASNSAPRGLAGSKPPLVRSHIESCMQHNWTAGSALQLPCPAGFLLDASESRYTDSRRQQLAERAWSLSSARLAVLSPVRSAPTTMPDASPEDGGQTEISQGRSRRPI